MRFLYTFLLGLIAPFAFGWLAIRGRRQTGAPDAGRERRGHLAARATGSPIWIHAASLGEARAAQALIDALIADYPLIITTFTATARRHCRERYAGRATVAALPYDLPLFVNRFLRTARPRLALFIETEIWPNLYQESSRRGIPIAIVSARMSSRAFVRYKRVSGLVAICLRQVAHVAAQSRRDADRFIALGASAERVAVTGNLKFDTPSAPDSATRGADLRSRLFGKRPVWVAGSTREGEEEPVLRAFNTVRGQIRDCVLVIAPRHPERAGDAAASAKAMGLETVRRSACQAQACDAPVLIVDAVGELNDFYAAADVVFVGGTLVDVGGHNILEPAALGQAVVTGPALENWRELAADMMAAGGLVTVTGTEELSAAISRLLASPDERARMGEAARACVERNRGAVSRVLRLIHSLLDRHGG